MRLLLTAAVCGVLFAGGAAYSQAPPGDSKHAEAMVREFRRRNGNTPEALEAMSWLGRQALAEKRYDAALSYAQETEGLVQDRLKTHKLDDDKSTPIALGAAIEVQGQALAAQGKRTEAVAYLRRELATYGSTSIRARINKNINLLSLEGKPAPALRFTQWQGPKPVPLLSLRGRPVLLFFWAHWCSDCKGEEPILERIMQEFGPKGLVLVGPTQRYGYAAQGEDATPAQEFAYIDEIRKKYYAGLTQMAVPVDEETFRNYGASTTPTLVLIDKTGIVRMYHPGAMPFEELAQKIKPLVTAAGNGR